MNRSLMVAVSFLCLSMVILSFQNCSKPHQLGQKNIQQIETKLESGSCGNSLNDEIQNLETSIQSFNGDLHCEVDSDCGNIALGDKACGGPEKYLLFSQLNSAKENLFILAEQHQITSKAFNQKCATDRVSSCDYEFPPETQCLNNTCALRESSGRYSFAN